MTESFFSGKSSASTDQLTKGELNTPVLKALLQQTTLEVCKPSSKEAPVSSSFVLFYRIKNVFHVIVCFCLRPRLSVILFE